MGKIINENDFLRSMVKKTRVLLEQELSYKDYGQDTNSDEFNDQRDDELKPEEKRKEYTISGGKIIVHGYDDNDLDLTDEEKSSFQETMDEFVEQVTDLVDFNPLHIYENNIEWSGKMVTFDLEYFYTLGENTGVYLNGQMIKVDDDFIDMTNKLRQYYKTFTSKWAKVIGSRKKTEGNDDI